MTSMLFVPVLYHIAHSNDDDLGFVVYREKRSMTTVAYRSSRPGGKIVKCSTIVTITNNYCCDLKS